MKTFGCSLAPKIFGSPKKTQRKEWPLYFLGGLGETPQVRVFLYNRRFSLNAMSAPRLTGKLHATIERQEIILVTEIKLPDLTTPTQRKCSFDKKALSFNGSYIIVQIVPEVSQQTCQFLRKRVFKIWMFFEGSQIHFQNVVKRRTFCVFWNRFTFFFAFPKLNKTPMPFPCLKLLILSGENFAWRETC